MRFNNKYFTLLAGYIAIITAAYSKIRMDDSYIYFSYVKNITSGKGFVFNEGELVNAATSPLYTLLLTVLYTLFKWTGISIPLLAQIMGGILLFISAIMLFKIFDDKRFFPAQYFIPLLFLTNPLIRNGTGMESYLVILMVLAAVLMYLKNNLMMTALFGTLAILARFDASLFLIPIGINLLMRKEYKKLIILIGLILIFVAPWFLFSYWYFGELLPATIKVKMLQQSTGYWGSGLIYLKGLFDSFPGGFITGIIFISLTIISSIILIFKPVNLDDRRVYLLLSWVMLYFIVYSLILNPPPYLWYYTPLAVFISIVISFALKTLIAEWNIRHASIFLLFFFLIGIIIPVLTAAGPYNPKFLLYKKAAEWINDDSNYPVVAIDEVGVLRFYLKEGRVVDILGLVNPEASDYLINKDFKGFINHYNPDYIITESAKKPAYMEFTNTQEFQNMYTPKKILNEGVKEIMIFKRNKAHTGI